MLNKIAYILLLLSVIFCFNLSIDQYFGTVLIGDTNYDSPFLGGLNKPKIQWLDWDDNGMDDLFLLDEDGHIRYYKPEYCNNGQLCFNLKTTSFLNISDILWFYIYDFDNDNQFEIIMSNPNNLSEVAYYDIIDDNIILNGNITNSQGINISIDPVMVPCFADIDGDGDLDMFSGNVVGTVNYFENISFSDNIPTFNLESEFWQEIYIVGSSQRHGASAINFIDLDNDNDLDLSWGDYFQQSLYIIWNIGTSSSPNMDVENISFQFPPNDPIFTAGLNMPTFSDIDQDNDMDLFVTTLSGAYGYQLTNNFAYYNNDNNDFTFQTSNFIDTIDLLSDVNPKFIDIDNDDDMDLFIGTDFDPSSFPWTGKLLYFENIGYDIYGEPIWEKKGDNFLDNYEFDVNNLYPEFVDIDADDDFDLFVGEFNGVLHYFENIGNSDIVNMSYLGIIEGIDLPGYSTPEFVDLDSDDDYDLLLGNMSGSISYYENIGNKYEHVFNLITDNFQNINVNSHSSVLSLNLDGDDDYDFIIGSGNDNVIYYKNIGDKYNLNLELSDDYSFPYIGDNVSLDYCNNSDFKGILAGISTGGFYYFPILTIGDLNQDSIFNIFDIILLVELIINNGEYIYWADINHDSVIDIIDIINLINIVLEA